MIKVLEVIRQGEIGGGESHLLDLISFFDKNIIEPYCLSFSDGEMVSRLKSMKIPCYVIKTERPFDHKVQKQIKQLITTEKIQLIHAHGSRAISNVVWCAKTMRIPLIYTVHGWSFHDDQSYIAKEIRSLCEKFMCIFSNEVICVSKSNYETGKVAFGLKHAHIIENGINLERFNPKRDMQDLRPSMGLDGHDIVIGFIARCTKQKNPLSFLEAIEKSHAKNNRIKGVFIGEGDLDEEVNAYIQSHKMQSFLYRSSFRTDVPEILKAIDIYCLPSLWEGLSIALLEAMAMEKAIIATHTDGTIELIEDEKNGIIVPFYDNDALANAMNLLAEEENMRYRLGKEARKQVEERFNAKRVADMVTIIYEKNIKKKGFFSFLSFF